MSKTIDLWEKLPPDKIVNLCERFGVVFGLDERDHLTYTLPTNISPELLQLIEGKREVIHLVLWCQRVNKPLWYWHTIHSPRYRNKLYQ